MLHIERIKGYDDESTSLYRIVDITIILSVLYFCSSLYLDKVQVEYFYAGFFMVVMYMATTEVAGLYKDIYHSSLIRKIGISLTCWIASSLFFLTVSFVTKSLGLYADLIMLLWFVTVPVVLMLWRWIIHKLSYFSTLDKCYKQKTVIIGATPTGLKLADEIIKNKHLELELVGIYDDRPLDRLGLEASDLPVEFKGSVEDVRKLAKDSSIKNVYIVLPLEATSRTKEIVHSFSDSTARVFIVPNFHTYDLMQAKWGYLGSIPTLSVRDSPFYGFSRFSKRAEDLLLASMIICLISPVLLLVSTGVLLSSRGPVLFKQKRYGLDGRPIIVWKFRSMTTQEDGETVEQAKRNDPRVTKFGSFIRRTSLDELPQFFNVITGQMSIVGPRPHAVAHNEKYRTLIDKYMLRHHVKPGITGWAQINGYRGETDTLDKMEKRIEYDLIYIKSWSVKLDLKIIFLTIFKGFVGKTAY